MAPTPLSNAELAAVAALVSAGRVCLRAIVSTPPGDGAARRFDQLRRSRNQSHYEAAPIGRAAADQAVSVAEELFASAVARGVAP